MLDRRIVAVALVYNRESQWHMSQGAQTSGKWSQAGRRKRKRFAGSNLDSGGLDGLSVADPKPAQTRQGGASE